MIVSVRSLPLVQVLTAVLTCTHVSVCVAGTQPPCREVLTALGQLSVHISARTAMLGRSSKSYNC